ncbi:hypothetical protein ACFPRL_23060 [Pseudoclavibacter helvolus]
MEGCTCSTRGTKKRTSTSSTFVDLVLTPEGFQPSGVDLFPTEPLG